MASGNKLNSHRLRKWSVAVRWRDRTCQICGSKEKLQAHHIYDKSFHPDQAYDLDNGVTLCGDDKKTGSACHRTFHNLFMGGYRKKCTLADFKKFQLLVRWVNSQYVLV